MAKLKWVILCEKALLEAGSNALSLISMIEEVKIHGEPPPASGKNRPMIPHRLAVVQFWVRSKEDTPETAEIRSRLIAPNGKVFATATQTVDLTTANGIRVITNSPGFPWFGVGDYAVELQTQTDGGRWRTAGREKFSVVVINRDSRTPAPTAPSTAQ
jgi:hypothetical protein